MQAPGPVTKSTLELLAASLNQTCFIVWPALLSVPGVAEGSSLQGSFLRGGILPRTSWQEPNMF